jgi:hypothetical protein
LNLRRNMALLGVCSLDELESQLIARLALRFI